MRGSDGGTNGSIMALVGHQYSNEDWGGRRSVS